MMVATGEGRLCVRETLGGGWLCWGEGDSAHRMSQPSVDRVVRNRQHRAARLVQPDGGAVGVGGSGGGGSDAVGEGDGDGRGSSRLTFGLGAAGCQVRGQPQPSR